MTIPPKAVYRFNAIPKKLPMAFFTELDQKHFKSVWKHKTLNSQSNPEEKNGAGGFRLPDFTLYYKSTVIKVVCYWQQNRHLDQWNRTESLEIYPSIYVGSINL